MENQAISTIDVKKMTSQQKIDYYAVKELREGFGRPRKFTDPEKLNILAEKFFQECDEKEEPYTITGLALAMGFCSRKQFLEYAAHKDFRNALEPHKSRCEAYAEKRLFQGPAAGPIFALKNYGWKDTSETTVTVKPPVLVDTLDAIEGEYQDLTPNEESPLLTSGDSDDNDSKD